MPHEVRLPKNLRQQGWKLKISEFERLEPPHVTIFHKMQTWRLGLRDELFLVPPGGNWVQIDPRVRAIVEQQWEELRDAWDRIYPSNPIESDAENEHENGDE